NTNSVVRVSNGCSDTDNNAVDFTASAANPRNSASPTNVCGPSNPMGTGAANPSSVSAGDTSLLTVTVIPGFNPVSTGITETGDLSSIGGSAAQPFFDDGTNGDATAGDNVFSFNATVAAGTSAGNKNIPITISDAQSRTGTASITVTVGAQGTLAIH